MLYLLIFQIPQVYVFAIPVRDAGEKKEKMGIKKEMGDGRREESEEMREKEDRRGERLAWNT